MWAVLAGKLWFLGKSRSNPLCMGEGVGGSFGLAWTNVVFRELVSNGKLLGRMTLASHMGEYFGKLWFRSYGGTKQSFPEILNHVAGKGHPPLANSHYSLAAESRRLSRPDQTYHPPLTHAQ